MAKARSPRTPETGRRPQRWRHRPTEVWATRYDGSREHLEEIEAWTHGRVRWDPHHQMAVVCTPQGTRYVNVGDWVVKGVADEVYPVQSDIFQRAYDPVSPDHRALLGADQVRTMLANAATSDDVTYLRRAVELLGQTVQSLRS